MDEVYVRPVRHDDADAIADVYLASFTATYRFPLAHSDQQVRRWIAEILLPTEEVWVVLPTEEVWVVTDRDEAVVAMMALSSEMLDQLYVVPAWTGRGIGSCRSKLGFRTFDRRSGIAAARRWEPARSASQRFT